MNHLYKELLYRLDRVISRIYRNQLIKNTLLIVVVFSAALLIILWLEYFYYLAPIIKQSLFYLLLITLFILLITLIGIPLLKKWNIISRISRKEIATDIGRKYPKELGDTVVNILELKEENTKTNHSLVEASIKQKIEHQKYTPYEQAFRMKLDNRFWIFVVSIVVLLLISFGIIGFRDASKRFFDINTPYSSPPPFVIKVMNNEMAVKKGKDFKLNIKIVGDYSDQSPIIVERNSKSRMNRVGDSLFSYNFLNLSTSVDFRILLDSFYSSFFHIEVLPVPYINSFTINVDPPKYTQTKKYTLENESHVEVPEGTKLTWNFSTIDTDRLTMFFQQSNDSINSLCDKEHARIKKVINNSTSYGITAINNHFTEHNVLLSSISVIKDQKPSIHVVQASDSVHFSQQFFKGIISDDYGFSRLEAHIVPFGKKDSVVNLDVNKNILNQHFYYAIDFNNIESDKVEYWFTIWDNDAVNGSKSTRTEVFVYQQPSIIERASNSIERVSSIDSLTNESKQLISDIQKSVENFKMKQISTNMSEWEQKEELKNIVNKRDQLQSMLKEIADINKKSNHFENSFSKQEEDILKKQEEIQKLMDEVFSEELKKLMSEFNDLLDKYDENKFDKISNDLNQDLEDLDKQLENNLAHLKRLKVEQQMEMMSNKVDQMENKAQDAVDKLKKKDEIIKEEKELKEDFEDVNKLYEQLKNENKQLQDPFDFSEIDSQMNKVKEDVNDLGNIEDNKHHKKQKLQEIAQSLENLSNAIQNSISQQNGMETGEDIVEIKQILQNLIDYSFSQEELYNKTLALNRNNEGVNSIRREQRSLESYQHAFKDSLYALGARNSMINSVVYKELSELDNYTQRINNQFERGLYTQVSMVQRLSLTTVNNLALFLDDLIDQMEKNMNNMSGSSGSKGSKSKKSGSKGSNFDSLKKAQQKLSQQIKDMMGQMKNGQRPSNSSLGKAIREQEMMQNIINKLQSSGEVGGEGFNKLKEVDKMLNQNLSNLIHGDINNATLRRQELIFQKLLEAENASMKKKEYEQNRESKVGDEDLISNPAKLFQKDSLNTIQEIANPSNAKLNPYYQKIYNRFIKNIEKDSENHIK